MNADWDQPGLIEGLTPTSVLLEELTDAALYGAATVADLIIITGHFQHLILCLSVRDVFSVLSGLAGFLLLRI